MPQTLTVYQAGGKPIKKRPTPTTIRPRAGSRMLPFPPPAFPPPPTGDLHARPCHFPHPRRKLPRVVSAGGACRRSGRAIAGARLHGHQAPWLRCMGAHAGHSGWHVQGNRTPKCLLSALHSAVVPRKGGPARGGLRQGMRGGHPPSAGIGPRRQTDSHRQTGGTARRPPHQRDDHRRHVRQMGAVVA